MDNTSKESRQESGRRVRKVLPMSRILLLCSILHSSILHIAAAAEAAAAAEEHWAFQPVKTPAADATVDSLLEAAQQRAGLTPAPSADWHTLTRRAAFALTGLPPEPDVTLRVQDAASFAAAVDAWLASPHFGERWARHWMDVVRYADSKGHEYDYAILGAWRYRDWLVRSFNDNVPLGQIIREQIAGDLVSEPRRHPQTGDNDSLPGTIFWNLGESATSPVDLPNDEGDRIDNQLDVFGKTFLGLTIGCARCHDHKFDPISQRDYYSLFGILAHTPMDRAWTNDALYRDAAEKLRALRPSAPPPEGTVPALQLKPGELLADFSNGIPPGWTVVGDAEISGGALRTGGLSRRLPVRVRSPYFTITTEHVDLLMAARESTVLLSVNNIQVIRDPIYNRLRRTLEDGQWRWERFDTGRWKGARAYVEVWNAVADGPLEMRPGKSSVFALRALAAVQGEPPPVPPELQRDPLPADAPPRSPEALRIENDLPQPDWFLAVAEPAQGADTPLYRRGDANLPAAPVPRRFLPALESGAGAHLVTSGSGRRELADAVLAEGNPLTWRVAANRVWYWLFTEGLCRTPDDFGKLGDTPVLPELLDLIAWRFQHVHGGRLKPFIRELLLTRAWQRTSAAPSDARDPDNRFLARFPMRRLAAEEVRDAMLAVSGRLDKTMGGPGVPARARAKFFTNKIDRYENGEPEGEGRRSLYLSTRRNYPDAFLALFDQPAPVTSFTRRNVSNVPAQALAMMNDPLVTSLAGHWGRRMAAAPGDVRERVQQMHIAAFSRMPTEEDMAECLALLNADADDPSDPSRAAAWSRLALALFNTKEFLWIP